MRETMCTACKQRCAALSPSTQQPSYDSTLAVHSLNQGDFDDDTPTLFRMPKMKGFWQTLASCSSYFSINEAITSISNSIAEISTEQTTEIDYPTIYAPKDDLANTTIDVGFVHSLSHEENHISSASRDGGYLASSSSSPPINETNLSFEPTFYARKDDTEVDVEFVHSLCHEEKSVTSLCFSREGSYLAVAIEEGYNQCSIVIYDVESHAKYCELKEYACQYRSYRRPATVSLCFSANGRYLAAADADRRVIIWDLPNKRIRSIFQGHSGGYLPEVRFSPLGRMVVFCDGIALVFLNVRDNSMKMVSECRCFDFSPNGRHIATGNYDLAILDARTGKTVKRWDGHGTRTYPLRTIFTSDGKRLLCGYRGEVEHWDLNEAEPVLLWKSDIQIYLYAISPDNRLFVSSNELRDVISGKRHCTLEGHNRNICAVDSSAAGTYLAMGSYDGVVSLWKYART